MQSYLNTNEIIFNDCKLSFKNGWMQVDQIVFS